MEVPDDGLLEFLGSVDTADKDWRDYLAGTDIDKVARRAPRNGAPPADGVRPVDGPPPVDGASPPHAVPADPPSSASPGKSGPAVASP